MRDARREQEPGRDLEQARLPARSPFPRLPGGISNRAVAAWVQSRRAGVLQRRVTLPSGMSSVTLDEGDAERAARGHMNLPGANAYRQLRQMLSAAALARLERWIKDGIDRRFRSQAQLVAALNCNFEFTSAADTGTIDWVAGLDRWAADEAFQPVYGQDIGAIARRRLTNLLQEPEVTTFASLAALKATLQAWAAQQVEDLVAHDLPVADLDVAIAMYARLDQAAPNAEAILHKLDFRRAHHKQYQARGVDEQAASNTGLVYGPWRNTYTRAPTAGPQAVPDSENVHTMKLNVAWLLACCHHKVTFRLYAPLSRRAILRQQGTLSALGRELMGLVATGLYTVAEGGAQTQAISWPATPGYNDPATGVGPALAPLNETYVLTPTPAAMNATVAQLTVSSARTWDEVRSALNEEGLTVQARPELDEAIRTTSDDATKYDTAMEDLNNSIARLRGPLGKFAYDAQCKNATEKHKKATELAAKWGFAAPAALVTPPRTPPAPQDQAGPAGARVGVGNPAT